jgi:metallo-beta-lactamase class B
MRSLKAIVCLASAFLLTVPTVSAQRGRGGAAPAPEREPFQVFDNLYYIGDDTVSAWILQTTEGLIMIDAMFANSVDAALDRARQLGLDPEQIRYLFVSHGHGDHSGGAPRVKEVSGARVGMTEADWEMAGETPDLVMEDGDEITLGDTTIQFFVTPGHTRGVLSMRFPVRDGQATHTAFMFGGVGLNFSGVEQAEMYVDSVERLQGMTGIEVNIGNHPTMGDVFQRAERLEGRRPGDPHPFVDPAAFTAWLDELGVNGRAKLEEERAAAN